MKKFLYIFLAFLLCIGIGGGAYALTKHLNADSNIEQPSDSTSEDLPVATDVATIELKEGETLLTDPSDFRVNQWYRFYIDLTNPKSEAYIVLNLVTEDGGFNGTFREPGSDLEVDLPQVKIGISTDFLKGGYIYWNDEIRLCVDAEVGGGDDYFDIYLDENTFTGIGDNETIPDIWFDLTTETECLEVGAFEGGYVVVLEEQA